jgi:multidrug efflux pump subunit AcrA (membrane-fusion protein)
MKRAIIILAVLLVVAGVAGGAWWYLDQNPEWWFWLQGEFKKAVAELGLEAKPAPAGLVASGFVEADEASVTTELGGRIVALYADEGDEVEKGQVLVRLDDSLLLGKIQIAEADVAMAEAMLAQVKAGVPPEKVDYAKAQLDQAVEAQKAARVAWEDAQAMRDNPQDLELSITAAKAQLGVLDFQVQQAQAIANAAQTGRDFADTAVRDLEGFEPYRQWADVGTFNLGEIPPELPIPPSLSEGEYRFGRYKVTVQGDSVTVSVLVTIKVSASVLDEVRYNQALATYKSWTAWTGLSQAEAAREGASSYLEQLNQEVANPLTLQAQVDAAESQVHIAEANIALAQAQVTGLEMGATPEQIAAAEAQAEVAHAALEALQVQKDKFALSAPISGLVLERPVQVGEVAMPGAPQMTLGDLDNLTLTIYVPEDQLGKVQLGQPVSVTVDAYPDRVFLGVVKFIASQAEFTPKNVQTREERVNMVFAVKVSLPNLDHALKPGMPADAVVQDSGS